MKALNDDHRMGIWPKRSKSPGEPLYSLPEIADRLGVGYELIRRRATMNGGLRPWQEANKGKNFYRLSDARRWWATFEETA